MKITTKRTLSLLLALVMLITSCSALSMTALAKPKAKTINGFTYSYTVKDGKARLLFVSNAGSTSKTLKIPSKLGNCPVYRIGSYQGDGVSDGVATIHGEVLDITRVIIPDTVVTVDDYSIFLGSLKELNIGAKVKNFTCRSIECPWNDELTKITVSKKNKYFKVSDAGILYNKKMTKLIRYPSGKKTKSYTVSKKVTAIDDCAFVACKNLQKVVIPSSVKTIGEFAFGCCENLSSIKLSSKLTKLGNSAFMECSKLKSVTIPSGVKSVAESTFFGCASLKKVTIKNKSCKINKYAFDKDSHPNVVIKGYKNSTAQKYAKAQNYKFERIS